MIYQLIPQILTDNKRNTLLFVYLTLLLSERQGSIYWLGASRGI